MKYKEIIFVYPSRVVGGAQTLFYRLIKELVRNHITVGLIDYKDGWLRESLANENIEINFYPYLIEKNKEVLLHNEKSIVIMPSSFMNCVDRFISLESNASLFFWNIHPYNLHPLLPFVKGPLLKDGFLSKLIKNTVLKNAYFFAAELLNAAEKKEAICYMDSENYDASKLISDRVKRRYLPIPIEDGELQSGNKVDETYGWVGRLDNSFKIFSLERVLLDLDNAIKETGHFFIIGDGPGREYIKNVVSKLSKVEVFFLGSISPSNLPSILSSWKIGFAMGTSALEIARNGTATVLLDFSYKKIPSTYKYNWLYSSKGFILGKDVDRMDGSDGMTMHEILNKDLQKIEHYCLEYVNDNHSLNEVTDLLLNYIERSDFSIHECGSIYQKSRPLISQSTYRRIVKK